jgi:predicted RNase H-like HicB family nuclease
MELGEIVFVVKEDKEAGGFVASCHRYGIFTQGESLEEVREMVRDAVACRFEGEASKPRSIRLHILRDEVIAA